MLFICARIAMKNLVKKIFLYDLWFSALSQTYLYQWVKSIIAKTAVMMHDHPSQRMFIVGVTGTDGKTTTCNLIHKVINDNLDKALLISTANIKIGDREIFNHHKMTSLDPFALQALLAQAKQEGCRYAVLEVASHGISQNRFAGVDFDMAVLTNITPEHLDYHKTFEAYANTKKKLFTGILKNKKAVKYAVFPKDDESGRAWEEDMNFDKFLSYSLVASSSLKGEHLQIRADGTDFEVSYLGTAYKVSMSLVGRYNVYNALAAFSAGILLGIDPAKIAQSIGSLQGVSGRMQQIERDGVRYFIDFAHTPHALDSALQFVQDITKDGRVIVVFGAPGKRDVFKRPEMGRIADERADIVIVTDDDADTENRIKIIADIVAGIKRNEGENFFILPEREYALRMAIDLAKPGDTVLLAGKGHEQVHYTNFGKRKRNDYDKLQEYLANK